MYSMCLNKCLLVMVLFIVIPSLSAKPTQPFESILRKSCGSALRERVYRICQTRGGYKTIIMAQTRRIRRGIVDECCMKKCSDKHIYPYCSNDVHESDSEPLLDETPDFLTMDLEVAESRAPLLVPMKNVIPPKVDPAISAPAEKITLGPDSKYHDVYVKSNVKSEDLNRLIKALPETNNFQIGTVPPEFQSYGFIPSRAIRTRSYSSSNNNY